MSYIPCTETLTGSPPTAIDLNDHDGCVYIASPQFPYFYYSSSQCDWYIQASSPDMTIQLEIFFPDVSFSFKNNKLHPTLNPVQERASENTIRSKILVGPNVDSLDVFGSYDVVAMLDGSAYLRWTSGFDKLGYGWKVSETLFFVYVRCEH